MLPRASLSAPKGGGVRPKASSAVNLMGQQLRQKMVEKHVTKQANKVARAQEREKKFGPHRVTLGAEKGPTFLERKSVTESREVSYRSAWQTFVASYPKRKVKVMSLKCLDECATMHVNQMFWEGHNIADVHTFMAAVKFMRSDVRKLSDLPRSMKAARGFAKLAPVQGRAPLPFPCLAKIAEFLVMQGQPMIALWLMLTWAVCSHPGECLKLIWKNLIAPSPLQKHWVVILSSNTAEGKPQPSKVGEMDEATLIDQPYMAWLGPVLAKCRKKKKVHEPVFEFTMDKGAAWFKRAVVALNYQQSIPYQIRHGSASSDQMLGFRTLPDTMKRGRWKSLNSVRRYMNGGRLAEVFDTLSQEQQDEAIAAETKIAETFSRVCRNAPINR